MIEIINVCRDCGIKVSAQPIRAVFPDGSSARPMSLRWEDELGEIRCTDCVHHLLADVPFINVSQDNDRALVTVAYVSMGLTRTSIKHDLLTKAIESFGYEVVDSKGNWAIVTIEDPVMVKLKDLRDLKEVVYSMCDALKEILLDFTPGNTQHPIHRIIGFYPDPHLIKITRTP